ncbi:kinase-like protein [Thozetella sp. PMI_491]|nr:kinase-like protein [Thozetella sp. PMI_491]
MATLQVRGADFSVTKQKALEDAKMMQAAVRDDCVKAGKEVPAYSLEELIGKGSFGRVYKATDLGTKAMVAVKIIDIDESDTLNPKLADTYSEFMKEINALKLLKDSGAKNINHILDVLPVGQSMWMVTEYCAGGSVATLMKPTAPGGLQEKWIIPILREVAEAIKWVHKEGIIHRDIKCANVLINEAGAVQLCDFGVAGVIENRFDKRSTFIGTPHWMAPELFDQSPSYGTQVDIWAFGSMIFEIASGLPPNVMGGFSIQALGDYIKTHTPRLEGDRYSDALKDLVAFCLVEDPTNRPAIEEIQNHRYIFNTEAEYPAPSLANLVKAYKMWEAQGGSRKSLFDLGGAQGLQGTDYSSTALANDEWNFSTTMEFDRQVMSNTDAQAVYDVYGSNVDFEFPDQSSRTAKPKPSRRRPPPQLPAVKAPLEKLFDPNTITSYADNSLAYYGQLPPPPPSSDLPLRNDSLHQTLRESLIDLDASLHGDELSRFVDMETIRAGPRISTDDFDEMTDLNKPPLSDPADLKNNRRTQDWKFPSMQPPASANPEMSRFPFNDDRPTLGSGGRPNLVHHPSDPVGLQSQPYDLIVPRAQDSRPVSVSSLIDLDESLAMPDLTRPSTANSDVASVSGSDIGGANPFDLERHASLYQPMQGAPREPSIYISDTSEFARLAKPGSVDMTAQFPNGDARDSGYDEPVSDYGANDYLDAEYLTMGSRQSRGQISFPQQTRNSMDGPMPELPAAPAPPSARVMQGQASREEVRDDVMRMLAAFQDHLSFANAHLSSLPVRRAGPQSGNGAEMRQ